MATASEPRADPTPRAVAGEWLADAVRLTPARVVADRAGHRCDRGAHSYLPDGRALCWQPVGRAPRMYAVDAEPLRAAVPPALQRRTGSIAPQVFWAAWTRAEVRAKLRGIPIITFVTTVDWVADGDVAPGDLAPGGGGVEAGTVAVVTTTLDDGAGPLVISYGVLDPARLT
ncbi:hypothetical protein [Terracoccus luteus]|uniref:Uncharacterized protein n=1 Tax=Terracoccus luteus TaxID=53356 RepID=A0A495XXR2_9MICO|nr:hypothetical protein [Terracoccus luteus]MBB2985449.1 hypothetical protein [Terracoccus luteus]MCP2171101.1 hypothetical protein [Terracoccus luteus]RKT77293.1 hypothetical protein DFJ68_0713 [Terracoccus luteus]